MLMEKMQCDAATRRVLRFSFRPYWDDFNLLLACLVGSGKFPTSFHTACGITPGHLLPVLVRLAVVDAWRSGYGETRDQSLPSFFFVTVQLYNACLL
jgi:hypothetical protein